MDSVDSMTIKHTKTRRDLLKMTLAGFARSCAADPPHPPKLSTILNITPCKTLLPELEAPCCFFVEGILSCRGASPHPLD